MATKYFRAKADKGWSKSSIYDYIESVAGADYDEDGTEFKMFPKSKLTDKDCQWFADREFAIDGESEDYTAGERDELILELYERITDRG